MMSKLSAVIVAAALAGSASAAAAFPRVVTDLAAFRSGPGVTFLPVFAVPPQTVVSVKNCFHGWCRVDYAGTRGYIASSLLAKPIGPLPVAVVAPVAVPVVTPLPAVGLIAEPWPFF